MNNLISSTFRPSAPECLECHINGFKTKDINFDATKIKCPICANTMELSAFEERGTSTDEELAYHSREMQTWSIRRKNMYKISVTCPDCCAELSFVVTKFYAIGTRYDYLKTK